MFLSRPVRIPITEIHISHNVIVMWMLTVSVVVLNNRLRFVATSMFAIDHGQSEK